MSFLDPPLDKEYTHSLLPFGPSFLRHQVFGLPHKQTIDPLPDSSGLEKERTDDSREPAVETSFHQASEWARGCYSL